MRDLSAVEALGIALLGTGVPAYPARQKFRLTLPHVTVEHLDHPGPLPGAVLNPSY